MDENGKIQKTVDPQKLEPLVDTPWNILNIGYL